MSTDDRDVRVAVFSGLLLTLPALLGAAPARITQVYAKTPLRFEANSGQADARVKFLSRGLGYTIFLTPTEAVLSLNKTENGKTIRSVVRMRPLGANRAPEITGLGVLPGKTHSFTGNDPARWRTGLSSLAKVRYESVYPGIDLVYYGNQNLLEYDFVVAPGADPNRIRLGFEGASGLRIDEGGNLVLQTSGGDIVQHKPVVYQEFCGVRRLLPGRYVRAGKNQIGFEVARYDRSKPLVIDPALSYSTFLGGSLTDQAFGITIDSTGNAYVTGTTASADFPGGGAAGGGADAFVSKLNPTGTSLLFTTILGGNAADQGERIVLNGSGSIYLTGRTASTNFPTMNAYDASHNGGDDVFAARLDSAGVLQYSTYYGGAGADHGFGIAVDSAGSMHLTGRTTSDATTFPLSANAFDAIFGGSGVPDVFVAKINPALSGSAQLVYSTYLGGSSDDQGRGIVVDSADKPYVTGFTGSLGFPITPGCPGITCLMPPVQGAKAGVATVADAFVSKLDPDALTGPTSLVYSTFLGGTPTDQGMDLALDASGVYVTGITSSTASTFPGTSTSTVQPVYGGGVNDGFITKMNLTLSALIYSTYNGGTAVDEGRAISIDGMGNAYAGGLTLSGATFPAVNPLPNVGASSEAWVTKVNAAGTSRDFSSRFGGSLTDRAFDLAVSASGDIYVTGETAGGTFPTTAGAYQTVYGGNALDAWVAKIGSAVNQQPTANAGPDQTVECASSLGTAVTLNGSGSSDPEDALAALTFNWTWNSSSASGVSPVITLPLGMTTVTLTVTDTGSLFATDTVVINVQDTTAPSMTVSLSPPAIAPPADGRMVEINATIAANDVCDPAPTVKLLSITSNQVITAGDDYQDAVFNTDDRVFKLKAEKDLGSAGRTYYVTYRVMDASNNSFDVTTPISIGNTPPVANAGANQTLECTGAPPNCRVVMLSGAGSQDPDGDPLTYSWSFGATTGSGTNFTVTLPSLGPHVITLVVNDGQVNSAPANVTITVVDTVAPSLSVSASPNMLMPPNGKMIDVAVAHTVSDTCDSSVAVELVSIVSNFPADDAADIAGAAFNTADFSFQLRARRPGAGDRVYTITYKATDDAGNVTFAVITVVVPHDQGS